MTPTTQYMRSVISELQMYKSFYAEKKRNQFYIPVILLNFFAISFDKFFSNLKVLKPCEINAISNQPSGEGQRINVETTDLEFKVTPAIIELFSGVWTNYSQQQVQIQYSIAVCSAVLTFWHNRQLPRGS